MKGHNSSVSTRDQTEACLANMGGCKIRKTENDPSSRDFWTVRRILTSRYKDMKSRFQEILESNLGTKVKML